MRTAISPSPVPLAAFCAALAACGSAVAALVHRGCSLSMLLARPLLRVKHSKTSMVLLQSRIQGFLYARVEKPRLRKRLISDPHSTPNGAAMFLELTASLGNTRIQSADMKTLVCPSVR